MAVKWDNPNILTIIRQRAEQEYDRKAVEFLSKVGEMACAKARLIGTYTNRTGHLRNSISYIVLQNGAIKVDAFGHTEPMKESQKYAREMAKKYHVSIAQITRGSNALKRIGPKLEKFLRELLDLFRN